MGILGVSLPTRLSYRISGNPNEVCLKQRSLPCEVKFHSGSKVVSKLESVSTAVAVSCTVTLRADQMETQSRRSSIK